MTSAQGAGDKQREEADVVCHSEASQNPVDCLPNEILWKIIGFLSLEDLCYLAVCSKTWRNVTNTNSLWLHLCKLRDWERFGTEVDLRKETPIHSTGTSTSGTSPTFQTDSVINDDCNLKDLAPTCEWKEVYMRAWHLDRNWSEGRYQEHSLVLSDSGSDFNNATTRCVASDGTIFGAGDTTEYVGLWELKSGQFLQKIQPSKYIPLPRTSYNEIEAMTMKDNIGVAAFMGGILVFEASTGNVLKLIRGTASDFDRYKPSGLYMEEDKVIVSYRHYQRADNDEVTV
ncbi:probable E3 ubiquitin ligase complex SCF subunit sconB [Patiria miniata]|uniref:F-box domain-containing protein n=1 Tax=Patiria miniata TaxID=46514 RepID=A0A914BPE5_PATMI|nr:probable E3 ubiquitin ligase complex SCF subunit sconB [Patiria miniata]